MSRRTLTLVAVLAVLALGVAWLATRAVDPHATLGEPRGTPLGGAPAPDSAPPAAELAAPAPATAATGGESASPRTRAEPGSDRAEFPSDALWVAGRVAFPAGTPRDERVSVVATGRKLAGRIRHRFEVDADGRFRAAFAPDTKSATIDLEARYLYLPRAQKVDPRAGAVVELAPQLGGLVRVRLVPSPMAAARGVDLSGSRVQAHPGEHVAGDAPRSRDAVIDEHGRAEVGGLDPARSWRVVLDAPGYVAGMGSPCRPEPGAIVDVDLPVALPARLAGVVVDARGAPVGGAEIAVESRESSFTSWSSATSDEAGAFEVLLSGAGQAHLQVSRPGLLGARLGPFEFEEGSERAGLEVRLEDGLAAEGVVRWPDGRPAAEANVELRASDAASPESGPVQTRRTEPDGTFRFTGLEADRSYVVSSRVRAAKSADGPRTDRVSWTAVRAGVNAGARDLVLVLQKGGEVRGRVVDDLGAPVTEAIVTARPAGDLAAGRRPVSDGVQGKDGAFVLEGVGDGEWQVGARQKGAEPGAPETVVLPADAGRELVLVLPRPAAIAGQVLDADGQPAADAVVAVRPRLLGVLGQAREQRTGADGTFRVAGLAAGPAVVRAARNDSADSAALELQLAPGAEAPALVLRLRRGGTIEGRVLDARDAPRAGVSIQMSPSLSSGTSREAVTAADGTYRLERVTPGTVLLYASLDGDEQVGGSRTVLVEDGARVRVDFGGEVAGGVLVRGVVRGAGPIAGARVDFYSLGGSGDGSQASRTDDAGRYEARLPRHGGYWVQVDAGEAGQSSRRTVIPDVAEHVLDLDLGVGRIAGRVLDPDDRPLAGVYVQLQPEIVERDASESSGGFAQTKSDGTFAFGGLFPGTYEVEAGVRLGQVPGEVGAEYAPRRVTGIALEAGGARTGLDIRLERGRRLVVRVRGANGRPAAGAEVCWSVTGRIGPTVPADAAGVARLTGLPSGEVAVRAWTEFEMLREPARATVSADAAAEIVLDLVPAGRVRLRLERGDGTAVLEPWTIRNGVRDAAGKPVELEWTPAVDSGLLPLGPLAPGRYRVWARFGEAEVAQDVQVEAGAARDVTLREPG